MKPIVPPLSLKRLPIPRSLSSLRLSPRPLESISTVRAKAQSLKPVPRAQPGSKQRGFRSGTLDRKLGIAVELKAGLERGSRWKKTELIFHMLEKLAGEEGRYKEEMQLIAHQLHTDLFLPWLSLPPSLQAFVRTAHLEGFLSPLVPFYAVAEAWAQQCASLENQIRTSEDKLQLQIQEKDKSLQEKDSKIAELHAKVTLLEQKPKDEISPIALLQSQLHQTASEAVHTRQQLLQAQYSLESLSEELSIKADLLKSLNEDFNTTRKKLWEAEAIMAQWRVKLERRKDKARKLKLHCAEAIGKWKMANGRAAGLEERLKSVENEAISLRERAAAGFEELTPRLNWSLLGIATLDLYQRKRSSTVCFQDLLKLLESKSKTLTSKHKPRKTVQYVPEEKPLFPSESAEDQSKDA